MSDPKNLTLNLINAVINNNEEEVYTLLNEGAEPNAFLDDAQITPLHYAAQNNSSKVIQLLIEAGGNIHAKTQPDHQSPLEIATLYNFPQVIQLLTYYSQANITVT